MGSGTRKVSGFSRVYGPCGSGGGSSEDSSLASSGGSGGVQLIPQVSVRPSVNRRQSDQLGTTAAIASQRDSIVYGFVRKAVRSSSGRPCSSAVYPETNTT